MSATGSVTEWIGRFKAGEEEALERLRQRYWPYLVRLAHKKMVGLRLTAVDDEDVAQEAFWSFYRSFQTGGLPVLENRQHLFALLSIITAHKAANYREHVGTIKRGGGRVQGESAVDFVYGSKSARRGMEQIEDTGLSPEEAALATDLYRHYLSVLPDDLRDIAEQYLANRSLQEIADATGRAVCTVQRKINNFILPQWRRLAADSVSSLD